MSSLLRFSFIPADPTQTHLTRLEQAAQAEREALAVDAQIAEFFHVTRPFVTRQREHNPLWHEQMEVRWRTETFPPLAARKAREAQEARESSMSMAELTSQQAIDGIEQINKFFITEMFPPEPYVRQTWLEKTVNFLWNWLCRPDLWILIVAGLVLYLGMCGIGNAHSQGEIH